MIKTILFDLDGSLLPLDEGLFLKLYFGGLAKYFASLHPSPSFVEAVWQGTLAMMHNDGKESNEKAFWRTFKNQISGDYSYLDQEFTKYYRTDFQQVKAACRPDPLAGEIIGILKTKGYQLLLATNPLFPRGATEERIRWAGLDSNDFAIITTYEDNYYCKPNLAYYLDLLKRVDRQPEECLMVGNDVEEDMIVSQLGMKTFLLTECLNNPRGKDINVYEHGDLRDLREFVHKLP